MRFAVEGERWKGSGGAEERADKHTQIDTRLGRLVLGKTKIQAQKGTVDMVSGGAEGRADNVMVRPWKAGTYPKNR